VKGANKTATISWQHRSNTSGGIEGALALGLEEKK